MIIDSNENNDRQEYGEADASDESPTLAPAACDSWEHDDAKIDDAYYRALRTSTRLTKLETIDIYRNSNRRSAIDLHNQGYDVSFAYSDLHRRGDAGSSSDAAMRSSPASHTVERRVGGGRLFIWPEVFTIALLATFTGFLVGSLLL